MILDWIIYNHFTLFSVLGNILELFLKYIAVHKGTYFFKRVNMVSENWENNFSANKYSFYTGKYNIYINCIFDKVLDIYSFETVTIINDLSILILFSTFPAPQSMCVWGGF